MAPRVSVWVVGAVAALAAGSVMAFIPDDSPMVDYGREQDNVLEPAEGHAGDEVKMCINRAVIKEMFVPGSAWLLEATVCAKGPSPAAVVYKVTPRPGQTAGRIPPKCEPGGVPRPFKLPNCDGPFRTTSVLFAQRRMWWGKIVDIRQPGPSVVGNVLP